MMMAAKAESCMSQVCSIEQVIVNIPSHLLVLWVHLWVWKTWVVVWFVAGLRLGVVPSSVGGGHVVASGLSPGSLMDVRSVRSVRVFGADESAAARVAGRELALSGVAADASGGGPSSDGWRRTFVCGIWLGVAQWDMQAGVRLWAPPLIQTGSGWPFSVPWCAARHASAKADA